MAEKRRARRFLRRLRVQFGERSNRPFQHTGLTNDISSTGMFISTTAPLKPGTRIHAEVALEKDSLYVEGVVARQVIVPPELRTVLKAGVGMRFLSGADLLGELVPTAKDRAGLTLSYPTSGALREAWDRELRHGGAVVRSSERAQTINSTVTLEMALPFAGLNLAFEARVVHLAPEPAGKQTVALVFTDAPQVSQALGPLLT